MIRLMDVLLSAFGLTMLLPLLIILAGLGWLDNRSPLFFQKRLGRHRQEFVLVKFRTMRLDTVDMPTHMVSASFVTPLGQFLRRTKLDELPQLWNVLRGDMSLVGPRPGLPSHTALTEAREHAGLYEARPGITGLAQIRGIDMSTPVLLAAVDAEMVLGLNLKSYFKLIFLTAIGRGSGDRVR
jgi:O-antigen biosynthesis protein WbqP